tara:strand:- start:1240 stop:1638 length:399 start_codon:yes stop_codon:yes gene_type:complete
MRKRSLLSATVSATIASKQPQVSEEEVAVKKRLYTDYLILALADAKTYGWLYADYHYGKVDKRYWMEGMKDLLKSSLQQMLKVLPDEPCCEQARIKATVSLNTLIGINDQTRFWQAVDGIIGNPQVREHYNI